MNKLAQNGDSFGLTPVDISNSGIGEPSAAETLFSVLNVGLSLLSIVALIALVVVWIVGLVQVIQRKDLKESKVLWIILMIFVGTLGTIIYGFVEGRKKLAIWNIVFTLIPIISVVAFAVLAISFR